MEHSADPELPTYPRLRPVDPQWVEHQGQPYLYLRDPLGLSPSVVLIPQQLTPLLALCDGTRDLKALQSSLALLNGTQLSSENMEDVLRELDHAYLLSNGAYRGAADEVVTAYREAPHRTPSRAGTVYPADADRLTRELDASWEAASSGPQDEAPLGRLVGVVSPHIDFERGRKTYAELWKRAAPMLEDVELTLVFGTDHSGGRRAITPTRQSYATPLGVLPTDTATVDGLAEVIGAEGAYAEELHHVNEHSIELALVWFHHAIGGRPCPTVPILCGSFHHFTNGEHKPDGDETMTAALDYLRGATKGRRTLVIAAGDLAHMGPAFGDPQPMDIVARARLTTEDGESLGDICRGDADSLLERSRNEADVRRLCGLPPIYMALRYLDGSTGEHMGYDQCPADPDGGSLVSIAGVLLYEPT